MNDHALNSVTLADTARTEPLGQALLALNNAHAQELSWLEPERLEYLVGQAFLARRIGDLDAFLLAFDQGARYDSPNYLWFRNRYQRFVYIDRIVVASAARGRGCARRLYHDLFDHARLPAWRVEASKPRSPASHWRNGTVRRAAPDPPQRRAGREKSSSS